MTDLYNLPGVEATVVTALFKMLEGAGWGPVAADDGGCGYFPIASVDEALDVINSVEESKIRVAKGGERAQTLLFIVGNGIDILADHTCDTSEDFDKVMEDFLTYLYDLEENQ